MTQEKLAEKAEIDTSYLGQIERGVRQSPSIFVVAKIARALGIGEGELLEERQADPSNFDEGDIPKKIAEELKRLTPREQQLYDKIFRMLLELSELGRSK